MALPFVFSRGGENDGRRRVLLPWPDRLGGHPFAAAEMVFSG